MSYHAAPLTSLSICSGIGGLDLAVERVFGSRPVACVEREAYAQAVLLERMEAQALGAAPIHCDVRGFDGTRYRGLVDLVFGGIPCQPHSTAGKQRRGDDERDLIDEFLRVVGEVGPRLVFVENVRGFVARDGIGRLLGGLADLGFDAEWEVVSAAQVGASHRRERVFVLAHSHGGRCGWLSKHRLRDIKRETRRSNADGCDAPMAYSDGPEWGANAPAWNYTDRDRPEGQQADGGPATRGEAMGETVEHANSGCGYSAERHSSGHGLPADAQGTNRELGDPHRPRLEERQPEPVTRALPLPWPPGPSGDWSGVREDLHPALEPALCGVADGLPDELELAMRDRVDRLRCLGNAVVPAQAEAALRHLLGRLA